MDDSEIHTSTELWSGGLDEALVEIIYQETLENKICGSKITNHDHVRIANRLSSTGTKMVDPNQVKGKITRLKQRQQEFTNLMGQTGIGWNPTMKTVVVTEEHWARAIQVLPQWRKFKFNSCPEYEKLCIIFGQSVAIGVLHFAST